MITQSHLEECLSYNPGTGVFTWRVRPPEHFKKEMSHKSWNTKFSGKMAGHVNKIHGYLVISVENKDYRAHRLAWLYHHGHDPLTIDHIDGNKTNNKITNLRSVSLSENQKNRRIGRNTKNGIFGVRIDKRTGKYYARITVHGREVYLGCFSSFFSACCARKSAENSYKFHANHGSSL